MDPLRGKAYGTKEADEESLPQEQAEIQDPEAASKSLPKNKQGAIDEWIAMEQQKQRAIEAATRKQQEEVKAAKKVYKYRLAS